MPLKTDINKPYIDNIEAYDRDRHLITVSLSDRLDLVRIVSQEHNRSAQQLSILTEYQNFQNTLVKLD